MERREFLGWVGVGVLATYLPVALAACNSSTEESTTELQSPAASESPEIEQSVREDGFQAIGTIEQLEADGIISDSSSAAKPVLIFQNPNTNTIAAVNPTCTHQACTVKFNGDSQELACPCHGSKFGLDGKVIAGPAKEPLETYEAKQEDKLVLVKVS